MSNPGSTSSVDLASLSQFDMIIDVRSPGEFAEDHIPGAINLPVLDNEERAIVGTTYVQESRFLARRIGAAMVARNVARHLDTALRDQPPTFRPLIYCWRGGQRSNAMALILAQVGWRTLVLAGGYRAYRRDVQRRLYETPLPHRLVLLDGGTGVGKTAILNRAAQHGVQVIDLEALAGHRGSLFGAMADRAQPSQKGFESALLRTLDRLDPSRPVLVEAESNKIGVRTLPPMVWQAMCAAPRIELTAPLGVRVDHLVSSYADVIADRERLNAVLSRLSIYPGRKRIEGWTELASAGRYGELVAEVIERHYDPAYARARQRDERSTLAQVDVAALDEAGQDAAARQIATILAGGAPAAKADIHAARDEC